MFLNYRNQMKKKMYLSVLFALSTFLFYTSSAFADININILDNGESIYTSSVIFPEAGTVEINDNTSTPRTVNSQSALAILNQADILSEDFNISNLEYFSSYGSLYLKCITSTTGGEKCETPPSPEGWQYTVNGEYPGIGMDQKILEDGQSLHVYYGNRYRITLNDDSITEAGSLTVTAEEYDYENNEWFSRSGVVIGLTQPNPDDTWNPIEIIVKEVDTNGQAVFSSIPFGEYNIGVKEDFYYPTKPLTVTEVIISGGGSSGSRNKKKNTDTPVEEKKEIVDEVEEIEGFNIKKAFEYLALQQEENGSFNEEIYTDWTAIAFATLDEQTNEKTKIFQYLATTPSIGKNITDYERHSMALMSLGLNPYGTGGEDYISKIINEFDGKQFGDSSSYNDDVFAIIVLQNAGYEKNEKMLESALLFILEKQSADGSWSNSVDMTGATVSALSLFSDYPFVKQSLDRAKGFLKHSQEENGGFGNVSSTTWAIEGIISLGEKPKEWKHLKTEKSPFDYLDEMQDEDGGIKTEEGKEEEYKKNRIWETSYALTAISGKRWNEIMSKFPKKGNIKKINIIGNAISTEKNIDTIKESIDINTQNQKAEDLINDKNWFTTLLKKVFDIQ